MYWTYLKLTDDKLIKGELIREISHIMLKLYQIKGSETMSDNIMDHLWLGNKHAANNPAFINDNNITVVLNVTPVTFDVFPNITYHKFPIKDVDICSTPITDALNHFDRGSAIINDAINNNNNILVHCKRGHHRSAAMIAYYLIKYKNMSLLEAITFVKTIRPTAFSRMTCMTKTLIHYELSTML